MAEGEAVDLKSILTEQGPDEGNKEDSPECAVCLQPCIHPAQLPCGHIFCFLCIKGIANQSKKCAMCRQEIPRDFIDQPNLLSTARSIEVVESFDGGYQWFYEGRNGWWQYDERTSKELEASYKTGERTCELLIAGFLYVIDLEAMLQIRRNDPSRRRRIKRDLATIPKKGVAGLRTDSESQTVIDNDETQRSLGSAEGSSNALTPLTPSNTPQTPISGRESPNAVELESTITRIQALTLDRDSFEGSSFTHASNENRPDDGENANNGNNRLIHLRYNSLD